ncbi:MAG: aldo/keto reductase [Betaproteobacteria bacterium]
MSTVANMRTIFPATTSNVRLGLGGAPLGNLYKAISDADAYSVLHAALDDGCRSFDTAPHYGNGLSERRFGEALRVAVAGKRVLSTKVGRILLPDPKAPRDQNGYVDVLPFVQRWDYSRAGIRRSVEESMQRLGSAHIDVALIHDCDEATHGAGYAAVLKQVAQEAIPELAQMQREGMIGHYGLGVNDVQVCIDVLGVANVECLLLAGRYSLLDQSALTQLLPLCVQRGVRIALGGVFNSGILATGVANSHEPIRFNYAPASQDWIERTAAIEQVCARFDVPLRAAALQFPLAHAAIDVVVAGAQLPLHWKDAVAMLAHPIPDAFWRELKSLGLVPDEAPVPAGSAT